MKRTINALAIILLGIIILLANIDVLQIRDFMASWWPLALLVAAGLIIYNDRRNQLWAFWIAALGIVLLLNTLDILSIDFGDIFLPVIIVTIGISMLLNKHRPDVISGSAQRDEISAILSGNSSKITTKGYTGTKVTAVLGGVEIDLSKAQIKGEATLDVFVLMGGIELRVADDVVVKSRTSVVLGGIENKQNPIETTTSPILYIDGQIVMGGIEIKR